MQKLIDGVAGYKTYFIALVAAIYGVIEHHSSVSTLAPYLLSGAAVAALRAAVAKIEAVVARIEAKLPPSVAAPVEKAVNALESDVNKAL